MKLELATASDRVVVTATRAPLAVEESGVATDVFTAKDFEPARGAFVQNLLRDVPGVDVVQTGPQRRAYVGVCAEANRTRLWCCWMEFP